MAGLYPDVPAPRMAWHRDGSTGFYHPTASGTVTLLSQANMDLLNNEADDTYAIAGATYPDHYLGVLFPQLRDVSGYCFVSFASSGAGAFAAITDMRWSADTTNGMDGTWAQTLATVVWGNNVSVNPYYRTTIQTRSLTGVKGIKAKWYNQNYPMSARVMHWFGGPASGEVRHLMLTDTSDVEVTGAYFDMGDDSRGGPTEDKTFKVKNGHGTLTANSIVVSGSTLTNKSPSHLDDYMFSADGTTFTATINIGNLAPGASSSTLYVRRTTPSAAALGLEALIISAVAGSWT